MSSSWLPDHAGCLHIVVPTQLHPGQEPRWHSACGDKPDPVVGQDGVTRCRACERWQTMEWVGR